MLGAFMICIGVVLVLMALILVLPDAEPDGTTRDGIAGAKRRRSSSALRASDKGRSRR